MTILILTLIYFIFLFFYIFKRNGFDVAAFMALSYVISVSFAIVLGINTQLSDYKASDVSLFPTFLYCLFVTLLILPFYKFNTNKLRDFTIVVNQTIFDTISWFFIIVFILELVIYFPLLVSRLNASPEELAYLRNLAYAGEMEDLSTGYFSTGISHVLYTLLGVLTSGSAFMIIFFFYSICFLDKSKWFNTLLLICSMRPFIYSIITVDRHAFFYWFLAFVISYLLFKQYIITKKQKAFVGAITIIFTVFIALYMFMVTVARFGENDTGAGGGFLSYAGQSIYNNSIMWDELPSDHFNLHGVLPITSYIFEDVIGLDLKVGNIYSAVNNITLNGFNAIFGYFVREIGKIGAIVFLIFLCFVTRNFVRNSMRKDVNSLYSTSVILGFGLIVQCGFISYYYASWTLALGLWIILYITNRIR